MISPMDRRSFLAVTGLSWVGTAEHALANPVPKGVEGYPTRRSLVPGQTVEICASSQVPHFDVVIERVGHKRIPVGKREAVVGQAHETPVDASARGCRWPVACTWKLPSDLPSGYYSISFIPVGQAKATHQDWFVVRSANPGRHSRMLLQLSTNTYNAYCNWGGYSLYAYNGRHKVQGRRVSFQRPISGQFFHWEYAFVTWAERNGYPLDFAINSDLEFHPELLDHYRLVLSVGHDEYWSSPMRNSLEAFIKKGGNVAFFSGNTCCWQVRSENDGNELVCFKQSLGDDPLYRGEANPLLSTLWSHYLVGRPENTLTGVGFLHGGYHRSHGQFMDGSGAYSVCRPEHWVFSGTGLKAQDAFGAKHTIVGYECDGCEFVLKEGKPVPTGTDGTPLDFTILATSPARWHPDDCEWYERWPKGRQGHAVMGTYTHGGTVVTVGSTDWSHGLVGGDPTTERITKNILDRLSTQ